ncbi:MAG: sigma-70 family RNA polymerase sigma factor [Byssovorax sp.]
MIPLSAEQAKLVEEAMPHARQVARSLSFRSTGVEEQELVAEGHAVLVRRVLRFDAERGTTLGQYCFKEMKGAMLRAIRKARRDPLAAARLAIATHEEALDEGRDLAREIAETDAEKSARARALGEDVMAVAFLAYQQSRAVAPSPEEDLADHEERALVRGAVSSLGQEHAALLDLLYFQGLDWESVAERLGVSISSAQRMENKLIPKLRAALTARGIQRITA